MSFSFTHSILPMSDLRANLEQVKKRLTKTPIIITNKGRPDFGVCDLETLEIAVQVKSLKDLLKTRMKQRHHSQSADDLFRELDEKYNG